MYLINYKILIHICFIWYIWERDVGKVGQKKKLSMRGHFLVTL